MSSGRFANLASAGGALADVVGRRRDELSSNGPPLVLAVIPNGVPVALPVAAALDACAKGLNVTRGDEGVEIVSVPEVAGRVVIVIDDGVETGTVARTVVGPIRAAGAERVILAVPVCSREVLAQLGLMYDEVIAVTKPLARRALAWHFDDFDTIDDETAQALLRSP